MNMQLELTNYCNLSCVECPHRLMKRPKQHMSDEVFEKVLSYIMKIQPGSVILNKDGDPLLYPNILPAIRKISTVSNCGIDIYTNGLCLTDQFIDSLACLPNRIRLLITFHFYNHDGKRNDYSNVEKVLLRVIKRSYPRIQIICVTHATDLASTKELNEWRTFWDNPLPGLEAVINYNINPWSRKQISQKNVKQHDPNCPYENGAHLFIGNTGNIVSCCADLEEENNIANIMVDDFDFVMDKMNKFYSEMQQRNLTDLCKVCLSE